MYLGGTDHFFFFLGVYQVSLKKSVQLQLKNLTSNIVT